MHRASRLVRVAQSGQLSLSLATTPALHGIRGFSVCRQSNSQGQPTRLVNGTQRSGQRRRQCRGLQISASPTVESPASARTGGPVDAFGAPGYAGSSPVSRPLSATDTPVTEAAFVNGSASRSSELSTDANTNADARFEVIGSPYSLLSVSLSASQRLYTRRGTLAAVLGKAENAQSTLSLLSPLLRAPFGIPFLYQRISSTTPLSILIAARSQNTTCTILHLDGTTDWMVSQRNALLAWTGHTLAVTPRPQLRLPLAHVGACELTGRGIAALSAAGNIYTINLADGEEFVARPGHVVAYSITRTPPVPFRFKSHGPGQTAALAAAKTLHLQVPAARLNTWFTELPFVQAMRQTEAYKMATRALYALRTEARARVWGGRLFLRFHGPATLLLSSRGTSVLDVLSREQVNEIADAPVGAVTDAVKRVVEKDGRLGGNIGSSAKEAGLEAGKTEEEASKKA